MRAVALLALLLVPLSACVEPVPAPAAGDDVQPAADVPRTADRAAPTDQPTKEIEVDDVEFRAIMQPVDAAITVPPNVLELRVEATLVEGAFTDLRVAIADCGEVSFGVTFTGVAGRLGRETLCGAAPAGEHKLTITTDGEAMGSIIVTALVPE